MSRKNEASGDLSFVRFGIVGILNTLVGTAIMFALYNKLHCTYWQASFANYFFGSILSFFLNKYFTFRSEGRSLDEVLRFILNIAVCYGLAYGLAKPLMRYLLSGYPHRFRENAAMVVGMCLFTMLNYFGQKYFAFRTKETDIED